MPRDQQNGDHGDHDRQGRPEGGLVGKRAIQERRDDGKRNEKCDPMDRARSANEPQRKERVGRKEEAVEAEEPEVGVAVWREECGKEPGETCAEPEQESRVRSETNEAQF